MDGAVDVWDRTTPASACEWARAPAVRFALVARSSHYESRFNATTGQREGDPVTAAAPTWLGSADDPIDLTKNPDGSDNTDWQYYRYKTLEAVAPSRNIVWMGTQAGC
jgi:type IV pilus assembly protein PilW